MKYTYYRWNVDGRGLSSVLVSSFILGGASAWGGAIPVGNASFESPNPPPGYPVSTQIDVWQKTAQPVWFDPATTGGITWDQLSGVFPNVPSADSRHIDNVDGLQAAYLFALSSVGLQQDSLGANFEVGQAYTLTVGVLGGGGIMEGSSLRVGLYYLDVGGVPVPVAEPPRDRGVRV
jgi:hypothetical protein